MLPIVDSNWSPRHSYTKDCHILRAVAVQAAMPNREADSNLAALVKHATTPGLGGLPNGVAAYINVHAADALGRLSLLGKNEKVIGASIVLDGSPVAADVAAALVETLSETKSSLDICGELSEVANFLNRVQAVPDANIICNLSQCFHAGKLMAISQLPAALDSLKVNPNLTIKLTDILTEDMDGVVQELTMSLRDLTEAVGFDRVLLGSNSVGAPVLNEGTHWQYFDTCTRWATARERDLLFRDNVMRAYRI